MKFYDEIYERKISSCEYDCDSESSPGDNCDSFGMCDNCDHSYYDDNDKT